MVIVAQLVRALVCGAGSRRFEPGHSPIKVLMKIKTFFIIFDKVHIVKS